MTPSRAADLAAGPDVPAAGTPARENLRPSVPTRGAVAVLLVLLAVSLVVTIGLGPATIPPGETARYLWAAVTGGRIAAEEVTTYQIIWQIRTPRVLLAALVGAGLAAVGVAIQSLVRNVLADPYVLGVSSGASVGAVAVTVAGGLGALGIYAVSAGAFVGAMAAAVLVYLAAYSRAGVTPLRLVLTGVVMSFGFQALMAVIIYFTPDSEATATMLFWSMGSFGAATWGGLPLVAGTVVIGVLVLYRHSRTLDVLTFGDEASTSLGVDPTRMRRRLFVITSLVTGAMVAVSGAVAFVGLVLPHLVRIVVGASHQRVLVVAPLAGAVFMVWVDLISRTLVAPRELPLGVITALLGVPVFLALMRRRGYLFGGR
ncbi:FecCD family ABC transporter permease [Micromonospora marina]|uniref:Iron complex transport system permease protein n=1 Tax=Micromonospora marina TaxID=307120 RepID=A0A1C5A797_9ACTN|nr:iron ABC transporter permease [Micromonospora marina]SCF41123.1 iron complex transport system permease protein [Micromonospora marina]